MHSRTAVQRISGNLCRTLAGACDDMLEAARTPPAGSVHMQACRDFSACARKARMLVFDDICRVPAASQENFAKQA